MPQSQQNLMLNTEDLLCIGWSKDIPVSYTTHDCVLYALAVGAKELCLVYEKHDDFAPMPTLPFALCFRGDNPDLQPFPSDALAVLQPLPPEFIPRILDPCHALM